VSEPRRQPALHRATTRSAVTRFVAAVGLVGVCAGGSGCVARGPTIGPDTASEDTVLQSRIEQALATALDVDANTVTVEAARGVVTVGGQVASGFEQQSIGAIVRAVPGVTRVRFDIQVEAPGAGR
jgi:osmotically-inducible protein OsmY